MPDINENTFSNYASDLSARAEKLTNEILQLQAQYAKAVAENPQEAIRLQRQIAAKYDKLVRDFLGDAAEQMKGILPKAYLRGIQQANGQATTLLGEAEATGGVSIPPSLLFRGYEKFKGQIGPVSQPALKLLADFPEHLTMYQVFEAASESQIQDMRLPIIRSAGDSLREIAIQSGTARYKEAENFTRRKMSQDILNRAADRGITGMIDIGGRRFQVDSYAELVARTQTGNASRIAQMNRQSQYGLDLVRVSSHSPCSTLCEPWQGRVYSLSGQSGQYPPLDEAISGGLYHTNCKHSQSAYVPGVSEKLENPGQFANDKRANKQAYKIEQQQRYNERQIKYWKRRESVAITAQEQAKAKAKISAWQAKNRELVKQHDYLRRKYAREQI